MRHLIIIAASLSLLACTTTDIGPEPSLAPRAAESIDPRVPVAPTEAIDQLEPSLAALLADAVAKAEAGRAEFAERAATADRLASGAGAVASESWIAAQAALSRLIEQQGVATSAAADVDGMAGQQLNDRRWIGPTNRKAIDDASTRIGAITSEQAAIIDRLKDRLAR